MTTQPHSESEASALQLGIPTTWLLVLSLIAISLLVFANSFGQEFIWDDNALVAQNWLLQDPGQWWRLFTTDMWGFAQDAGQGHDLYRPLVSLTYLVDVQLWGPRVPYYHITNLLFHVLSTLVVFGILREILKAPGPAWAGALLFVVHPIHTEAVNWINGRTDVICGFFCFLSFYLYLRFRQGERWAALGGSLAAFLLALLAKEMAVTLPFVILLYDLCFPDDGDGETQSAGGERMQSARSRVGRALAEAVPYLAVLVLYLAIRLVVLGTPFASPDRGEPGPSGPGSPLLLASRVVALYLRLLVAPFPLNAVRQIGDLEAAGQSAAWLAPAILAAVFLLGMIAWRRARAVAFAIFFFFLTVLPVSWLLPVGNWVGERFLYIPSLAVSLAAGWLAASLWPARRNLAIALALVVAVPWAVLTFARNGVWQDRLTFWSAAVAASPGSTTAHNFLGLEYWNRGQNGQAIAEFEAALQIDPGDDSAYNNLGVVYSSEGRFEEAATAFRAAIELAPDGARAYHNLGVVHQNVGDMEAAIEAYRQALERDPWYAPSILNLGLLLADLGQWEEAAYHFQRLLEVDPRSLQAHLGLGRVFLGVGDLEQAIMAYEKALEIAPDSPQALNDLGLAYLNQGRANDAIIQLEKLVRIAPQFVPGHMNLALAYRAIGSDARALDELAAALQLDPGNQEARRLIEEWTVP